MTDEDFNLARLAFELGLHRNTSDDKVTISREDLEPAHQEILKHLNHDTWTDRQELLTKTKFREKQLKKHLRFLQENEYAEERKKPNERRERQYRKL